MKSRSGCCYWFFASLFFTSSRCGSPVGKAILALCHVASTLPLVTLVKSCWWAPVRVKSRSKCCSGFCAGGPQASSSTELMTVKGSSADLSGNRSVRCLFPGGALFSDIVVAGLLQGKELQNGTRVDPKISLVTACFRSAQNHHYQEQHLNHHYVVVSSYSSSPPASAPYHCYQHNRLNYRSSAFSHYHH